MKFVTKRSLNICRNLNFKSAILDSSTTMIELIFLPSQRLGILVLGQGLYGRRLNMVPDPL